jgi:hypothetical protein
MIFQQQGPGFMQTQTLQPFLPILPFFPDQDLFINSSTSIGIPGPVGPPGPPGPPGTPGLVPTVLVEQPDTPYTVLDSDYYIGVVGTGGLITILLPTGIDGRELIIKAEFGDLSSIQITPQSGQYVEGAGAGLLLTVVAPATPSVTLIFRADNWNVV